jgi:hypothetical protein
MRSGSVDVVGQSQTALTMNIYGHVIPAMQQEAAGHMDAALDDLDAPKDRDLADEN